MRSAAPAGLPGSPVGPYHRRVEAMQPCGTRRASQHHRGLCHLVCRLRSAGGSLFRNPCGRLVHIALGPSGEPQQDPRTFGLPSVARDHLLAWEASQCLVAIHESGHACAAAALGIPVRAIDITNRHGGTTQVNLA